jgi:structural maintenance of chromosome 3 (chondroitin sulfate proteoglycan 6)
MHIQSITISGFKSYRDATIAGPFSPSHNVVVGRNGSGKSNFFDAVRFLLADSFAHLRGEERVALLHEGAGASVLSAYVEMVFDNSDARLPFDRDTVALRRMVGLQKDEYVLDRKNVTRSEVFNLLESAGFSRSNPYYIVQQGKVAALCAMSDRNRLELLKEVAGTRVYDERRDESLRIMDETDAKREKISDVIRYIEARLTELDSEKDDLKKFQALDRDRRALEYTIYVKDLDAAKVALKLLAANRELRNEVDGEASSRLDALQVTLKSLEDEIKNVQIEKVSAEASRVELERSLQNAMTRVAKLEVDLGEGERNASTADEALQRAKEDLEALDVTVKQRRAELEPVQTKFAAVKEREQECRRSAAALDAAILSLRVKGERINQFKTVADRNRFLKREIANVAKSTETARKQRVKAEADLGRLEVACASNEKKAAVRLAEIAELEERGKLLDTELVELRVQRDAVHAQRHETWRLDAELTAKLSVISDHLRRLEAAKRMAFGAGTFNAIKAVMNASAADPLNLGPNRVFGPLADLIEVDEKFETAAEVTAGNSLTFVVVDTDATAARLVRILQDHRAGRVTFIPLSRLSTAAPHLPETSPNAIPLISKVKCDAQFLPATRQVFGRTMVTRSVDVAAQMSASHGVDCVTLEGDQVNKQGAMTGGFVDLSRSKLDAARQLRDKQDEMATEGPLANQASANASSVDAQLSKLLGEIQQRDAVHRSCVSKVGRLRSEVEQLTRYGQLDFDNIPLAKERIVSVDETIAASEKRRVELELEMAAPLTAGLSVEDEQMLRDMANDLKYVEEQGAKARSERIGLEGTVSSLKAELDGNLELRRSELCRVVEAGGAACVEKNSGGEIGFAVEELRTQLSHSKLEFASFQNSLTELEAKCKGFETEQADLESRSGTAKDEETALLKRLEEDKSKAETMFSQRAMLVQKKADAERKIRELGSLPADFDKYRSIPNGTLLKKLKRTNEGLKAFAHVNKKALDQFLNFTEQREVLRKRREELESGAAAIRQLIESLDHRKDADILRTFKGVSKYFVEVFSELVPSGKASLVMLKSSGGEAAAPGRISYSGVAMKVSFSAAGEAYLLQQLSGGQKSIVALALIFAIQRLDPAPFYLFDEIDANLDATHRQAVANVIRKQAGNKAQFITTTFRPEFVNAGDKWFGVTHRNKVSSVQEVTQEVARTFINKDEGRGQ